MKVISLMYINYSKISKFEVFCKDDADIIENIKNLAHTRGVERVFTDEKNRSIYMPEKNVNRLYIETDIRPASIQETNEYYCDVYIDNKPKLRIVSEAE